MRKGRTLTAAATLGTPKTRAKTTLVKRRPTGDKILSAAATLFAKRGYGETSLRDLMSSAGVSTTAFYVRFGSKEDVLNALVEQLLADLYAAAMATLDAGGDMDTGFKRGVEATTKVLLRHRITARLALTEAACSTKSRDALGRTYTQLASLLGARLQQLTSPSFARSSEANAKGWALVGALAMQVQRWAVFGDLDDAGLESALSSIARELMPLARSRRRR